MFTTFVGVSPRESAQKGAAVPAPRPKRSQVHRACDWCRLNRVKCDNSRPCHNCKQIDRRCSNDGLNEFRSLASATKEVERLRAQIRDFERRLKAANDGNTPTPPLTPDKSRLPLEDTLEYYEARPTTWEGIHIASDFQSQNAHYYGPFSTQFFTKQLALFLAAVMNQPLLDIEPYYETGATSVPLGGLACLSLEDHINCDYLMKMQQDYLLDLFWSRQHACFPLIEQAEFRRHYESLWSESSMGVAFRKPSPIVDIVLALCIQFGAALIPRDEASRSSPSDVEDTRLAGRIYFQRCHALLNEEGNTTSVTAVQCYVYSVMYLINAGLMNSAQALLATAIQTAHTIGLHHEPPEHLMEPERELRRRLWWSLYILDSTTGMSLGRPWLTQLVSASCRLPNDSLGIAQALGPSYQVPNGLKLQRQGKGGSFSTDRSRLEFDFSAPVWLQRQRLVLELRYHNYAMNLYRPFICFSPTSSSTFTPLSDNNAIACLNHAIAITNIIYQTFMETDLLNGLHCVFKYQQNAVFTAVGYSCAYPISPPASSARKALATAISVFEQFGAGFAPASNAIHLTRELAAKVDFVVNNVRSGFSTSSLSRKSSFATAAPASSSSDHQSLASSLSALDTAAMSSSNPSSTLGSPPMMEHVTTTGMDSMAALDPVTTGADLDSLWMSMEPASAVGNVEQLWSTTAAADGFGIRDFDFPSHGHGHPQHHQFQS
ncbi:putative fungal specific transcription factor domain-containing protein [Neofusicoccum parvum UCRNP2]|uniref:Putative fungal specific transcription factor domain-containing protein n=1 Tax=Botryosphaeria parva (strain UCR-NP2) TaxID=1287680 RepID=R1G2K3_BOTPV|nr:putative fungal specific transcription factor domain-containing protein [Neofusicoccum parvum UCRNP2]